MNPASRSLTFEEMMQEQLLSLHDLLLTLHRKAQAPTCDRGILAPNTGIPIAQITSLTNSFTQLASAYSRHIGHDNDDGERASTFDRRALYDAYYARIEEMKAVKN